MMSDGYILNYCFVCKHHNPDKNSGMDIFCDKENSFVFNYQAQKCRKLKWFTPITGGQECHTQNMSGGTL